MGVTESGFKASRHIILTESGMNVMLDQMVRLVESHRFHPSGARHEQLR